MAGGRPTKYDAEVLEKTEDYLTNYNAKYGDAFPSVVGLCKAIERSRSIIYDWAKDKDKSEFSDMLAQINEIQEQVILNNSIKNEFNAAISKLVLGKHGYHDKADNTLSGPNGGPIETTSITFVPVGKDDSSSKD
jgi:hypothetical protein